jgi:hypothetical protein
VLCEHYDTNNNPLSYICIGLIYGRHTKTQTGPKISLSSSRYCQRHIYVFSNVIKLCGQKSVATGILISCPSLKERKTFRRASHVGTHIVVIWLEHISSRKAVRILTTSHIFHTISPSADDSARAV